jgi:hypothetical protein
MNRRRPSKNTPQTPHRRRVHVRKLVDQVVGHRPLPRALGSAFPICRAAKAENLASCTTSSATQCRSNPVSGRSLPKTGVFQMSAGDYRLFRSESAQKSEPGDWWLIRESPPLAGLSASIWDIFSGRRTAWLATQWDSNRSQRRKFTNSPALARG